MGEFGFLMLEVIAKSVALFRSRLFWLIAVAMVTLSAVAVASKVWQARSLGRHQAASLTVLRQKLADSGVKLCLAFAPYRSRDGFKNNGEPYDGRSWLHRKMVIQGMEDSGIPVFDLYEGYRLIANDQDAFMDAFHVTALGASSLGSDLAPKLRNFLKGQGKPDARVVIMGECYAIDLAAGLQPHWTDPTKIDALRSYDDPMRVVDLLFRFADTHVKGTDVVIWLLPDNMIWGDFSTFRIPEPAIVDERIVSVRAKVLSDAGYDFRTWETVKQRLNYPNALAELKLYLQEEVSGLPKEIVVINYCVKNRLMTGFEGIKKDDTLVLRLQDLDGYLDQHRDIAGEAYLTRVDDFLAPRFWVLEWTKTGYTPSSAGRGGI